MLLQQPDKILPNPSGRALPNPSGKALPNPSLEGLSFSYGLSVRVVSSDCQFGLSVRVSSSLCLTYHPPGGTGGGLWGGLLDLFLRIFNTYSQLFGYNSLKIYFCKTNSTLPPYRHYMFNTQRVRRGGIMGGIWVELHEVPP